MGIGVITLRLRCLAGFVEDDTFMFEPIFKMVLLSLSISCDIIVDMSAYISD